MAAAKVSKRATQPTIYFTVPQIAELLGRGWSVRRTRRWLDRAGVLERRHGVVVTTGERLAASFPELYRRLVMADD